MAKNGFPPGVLKNMKAMGVAMEVRKVGEHKVERNPQAQKIRDQIEALGQQKRAIDEKISKLYTLMNEANCSDLSGQYAGKFLVHFTERSMSGAVMNRKAVQIQYCDHVTYEGNGFMRFMGHEIETKDYDLEKTIAWADGEKFEELDIYFSSIDAVWTKDEVFAFLDKFKISIDSQFESYKKRIESCLK